jgi:predicted Zn finger-like uncharacterized protein
MIVMCEGCETSFQVEDRLIKPTGSKVRCSKCRHIFIAYSPAAVAAPEEPLILSDELPPGPAAGGKAELEDIGSQIDALFTDDLALGSSASADQEPELLDMDDLLVEESPPADALTAETSEDDLKLDLDLDLNFDEDAAASPSAGPPPEGPSGEASGIDANLNMESALEAVPEDTLASLDELGINLDSLGQMDEEPIPAVEKTTEPANAETPELGPELDLNALAAEFSEESTPAPSGTEPLDASPELAAANSGIAAQAASESELDLSDLEAMLEGESREMEPKSAIPAEIDLELDMGAAASEGDEITEDLSALDLSSIAEEPVPAAESIPTTDGLPTEIELSIDLDESTSLEPAAAAAVEPPDDEIDFSEITSILEETPTDSGQDAEGEAPELDLLLGDGQPPEAPSAPAPQAELQDGLLLNIESLLQDEEASEATAEQKSSQATEELDLDLAVGPPPSTAEDLEIEPVADEAEGSPPEETAAVAGASDDAPAETEAQFPAEAFAEAETGAGSATQVLEMQSAAAAAAAAEEPRGSSVRKYLIAAVGVLVLAVAAIVVPRSLDIRIPFLSELELPFLGKILDSQPEDVAGNLKMAPIADNLTAEFIENEAAGRLCVVRGMVRNGYDHPRSAIQVTAKLYTKDKTLAKTATVFAGNVLSNQELATQEMAAIVARTKSKEGANNMNVGVKPGRSVPFMAVFDNLPGNLDEYSVEVAGSTK